MKEPVIYGLGINARGFNIANWAKEYGIHITLFLVALVIYLSVSYTLVDYDDLHYFLGAESLLQKHTYLVNGLPTKYPMGYSLLILPFFYLFGINVQSAVYPSAISGAVTVVILYQFAKNLLDKRAALFASLFLIFPLLSRAREVMADVPALFFMLLSIFAAVRYIKTERSSFAYLFYFAVGFACLIRYTSALIFVIVGLYILFSRKTHLLKKKEIWLGVPIFLGILVPQMLYNRLHFGSPFATGYSGQEMFRWEYFFTPGPVRPPLQILLYLKYYTGWFGTAILPFFFYGMWNLIRERNREVLSLILPWIIIPTLVFSFYFYPMARLVIFVFPALLIASGYGFSKICDILPIRDQTIKRFLLVLLVVILLTPAVIFWFDRVQRNEFRARFQKETFVWMYENSGDDDIIISHPGLSAEYYSKRKIHSPATSRDELSKLMFAHDNTYLFVPDVQGSDNSSMFEIKEWLDETYGLIHLKTFEGEVTLSPVFRLLHNIERQVGIRPYPTIDRWDIYLINKLGVPNGE